MVTPKQPPVAASEVSETTSSSALEGDGLLAGDNAANEAGHGDQNAAGVADSGSSITPELLERLKRLGVRLGADGLPDPIDVRKRPAELDASSNEHSASSGSRAAWSPGALPSERTPSPARMELAKAVPGREADNDFGTCWIAEIRRDGAAEHANEILDAARSAPVGALAEIARDPRLEALDVERAAFIDTETTGLAGGTGTFAFLIGAGRFVDGVFRVRQFFMRDPSEEASQLAELSAWLEGSEGLVTFNGRTFDVPLLDTRYIMNAMPAPWADPIHLDLLPPSRRIWRRHLESCALTSLEANVLGMERQDDVPGWLVPQRYKRYQVEGDARPLVGIFKHNALDILSMVSLLTRVARVWSEPETALQHGEEWLSLARAYEADGRTPSAIAACREALGRGLSAASTEDAHEQLALIHRRAGDWDPAIEIWRLMTDDPAARRLFPFEELAKYYEHRVEPRQLDRALEYAVRAMEMVEHRALRPKRGVFQANVDPEAQDRSTGEADRGSARYRLKLHVPNVPAMSDESIEGKEKGGHGYPRPPSSIDIIPCWTSRPEGTSPAAAKNHPTDCYWSTAGRSCCPDSVRRRSGPAPASARSWCRPLVRGRDRGS